MWKWLVPLALLATVSMAGCWHGVVRNNGAQGHAWVAGGGGPSVYHCVATGGQATCKAVVEQEK